MFIVALMLVLFAYCAWFAVQAAVPTGPQGMGRVGAKDRTGLLTSALTALSAVLLFRVLVPVGWWQVIGWLVIGVLFAVAVAFTVLRWRSLPTRRLRTQRRTGAQRPRSWVLVGAGLGFSVLFLSGCAFVHFAAHFA